MIAETSQLAFKNDVVPTLHGRHQAVMEELARLREATNNELAKSLGWEINRVTPRTNELVKLGLVKQTGKRQCRITGRLAYVWSVVSKQLELPIE